jgi:hypothetical protein
MCEYMCVCFCEYVNMNVCCMYTCIRDMNGNIINAFYILTHTHTHILNSTHLQVVASLYVDDLKVVARKD